MLTCPKLTEVAFRVSLLFSVVLAVSYIYLFLQNHVRCYVENGFCDVMKQVVNWDGLWKVYEIKTFFGRFWQESWSQVILYKIYILLV